jgi:hypothetical protein
MLLYIVERIRAWLVQRMVRKVKKTMTILYPDPEDRASAYLAEGAELASTIMFGVGEPLQGLMVYPEDGGYLVSVLEGRYEN